MLDNLYKWIIPISLFILVPFFMNASVIYSEEINAEELQIGIMLKWSTKTEMNNQMYVIQRSADGQKYEDIGSVEGKGNRNIESNYQYLDLNVGDTKMFYRLRQFDFDGTFTYSKMVVVQRENENNFLITKMNTTNILDFFEISVFSSEDLSLTYTLDNLKNEIVKEGEIEITEGDNPISIFMNDLKEGNYKFVLSSGTEKEELVIRKITEEELKRIMAFKR